MCWGCVVGTAGKKEGVFGRLYSNGPYGTARTKILVSEAKNSLDEGFFLIVVDVGCHLPEAVFLSRRPFWRVNHARPAVGTEQEKAAWPVSARPFILFFRLLSL